MVWSPDTAFRSTRLGFDSPWLRRPGPAPARALVCAVENRRMVWSPDTAFRSTRPGFDSPWRWSVPWKIAARFGGRTLPRRIGAWFGGRTPLSEARGLGSIPRGAGLCRGKSPHGSEAGHRFQKHEAWVRFPAAQVVWHGYHNCTLRELHERTIDWNPAMIDLKMISLFQSSPFNDSLADLCFGTLAIAHVV